MGTMMAGGGMHGGRRGEAAADALYAPDRLLAQADALWLTADQVVALQRVRDSQRDGRASASTAARNSREVLTKEQRLVVERREAPAMQAAPAHRHD